MTLLDTPISRPTTAPAGCFSQVMASHPYPRKWWAGKMLKSVGAARHWEIGDSSPTLDDAIASFASFPEPVQLTLLQTLTAGTRWSFHLRPPLEVDQAEARTAIREAVNATVLLVPLVIDFRQTRDESAMTPLEDHARTAQQSVERALAGCRSLIQTRRPSIDGGER